MDIRVGNASAPRWYDESLERLDSFIELQTRCGATSTELVLHHGDSDAQIARVHVLEEDWFSVFEKYRERGIICHVHAPLHPRFNLSRWLTDPKGLRADLIPVLSAVSAFAERQGVSTVLVVHGASGDPRVCEQITAQAIDWLAAESKLRSPGIDIALELRRALGPDDDRFDRGRASLASFVRSLGCSNVGICWDLGNEWSSRADSVDPIGTQDRSFLELVRHVHLHDVEPSDGIAHHPLCLEHLPWREMLRSMIGAGYDGAITMEIRYRHALARGEPWDVLADSYCRLVTFLDEAMPATRSSTFANEERGLAQAIHAI